MMKQQYPYIHQIFSCITFILFFSPCIRAQKTEYTSLEDGFIIRDLKEYNNELYACGFLVDSMHHGHAAIYKWNGNALCLAGLTQASGIATCMAVYHNELYVGGAFTDMEGKPANNIARWNGSRWAAAGKGVLNLTDPNPAFEDINVLTVYNNELYAGGDFDVAGQDSAKNIAAWDGNQWHKLSGSLGKRLFIPLSMTTFQQKLYVSAILDSMTSDPKIIDYDGNEWNSSEMQALTVNVGNMVVYNGVLCMVSRLKDSSLSINGWNGQRWERSISYPTTVIMGGLITYDGSLYAFGNGLYRYNDASRTWTSLVDSDFYTGFTFNSVAAYQGNFYSEYRYRFYRIHYPEDQQINPHYKIFPNPTTGIITIETIDPDQEMNYALYDCTGKRILSGKLSPNTCCQQINLQGKCASGLYFMRIEDGDKWQIEKVELLNEDR